MTIQRLRRYFLRLLFLAIGLVLLGTALLVAAGLRDDVAKSDVALVLGNKIEADGSPSLRLKARLDKTVELYQAGWFPRVIASGGVGKEGFDEAVVMKTYLVSRGIPDTAVIVDSDGITTYASARKTAVIARQENLKSVLVVSQYYHVPRSRLALERFGLSDVHGAHADFFEARDFYSVPRELFGYVSYLFRRYDPTK